MTFKAGDKVRYTGDCNTFSGRNGGFKPAEGVVTEPGGSGITNLQLTSAVRGYGKGSVVGLFTPNLELVPAEKAFTFADIQVGDKIRRTLTRESGTTEVREGVVTEKSALYATDTNTVKTGAINYILAYDSDGDPAKTSVVLELLDRPKPKHWTEAKPVGSAAVYLDGMFTKTFRKTGEDEWTVVYPEDGFTFEAKNQGLLTRFVAWDDAKLTWIR